MSCCQPLEWQLSACVSHSAGWGPQGSGQAPAWAPSGGRAAGSQHHGCQGCTEEAEWSVGVGSSPPFTASGGPWAGGPPSHGAAPPSCGEGKRQPRIKRQTCPWGGETPRWEEHADGPPAPPVSPFLSLPPSLPLAFFPCPSPVTLPRRSLHPLHSPPQWRRRKAERASGSFLSACTSAASHRGTGGDLGRSLGAWGPRGRPGRSSGQCCS